MAAGFDFHMDGLEELQRDLERAVHQAPIQAEETLVGLAKDFKESAKKRADAALNPHKRTGTQKNKAIKRKWGHKLLNENLGATALVWNSARHFHLVENGHNLVRGGRVVEFVSGKHIMEKTRNEYQDIIPERFEQMIDDVLGGCDLD